MLTKAELRVRFWLAIRDHAPEAWEELFETPTHGLSAWLAKHNLTDSWCREQAENQVKGWEKLRKATVDEQADPEGWRARRLKQVTEARAHLAQGLDPFDHEPLTKEQVQNRYRIVERYEEDTNTPLRESMLASVFPVKKEPRLAPDERTFRLEVEGWRPDRTMGETMARFSRSFEPDDDAVGHGWGESWQCAETRLRAEFEMALAEHRHLVEARLAELRPPVKKKNSTLDSHLRLLVWYQVLRHEPRELSMLEAADPLVGLQADTSRVRQAIKDTAGRLGLTLRRTGRGRPRKPKIPNR